MYVIDSSIWSGESEASALQVEAFFGLALRCVRFPLGEDVLTMIDVAKELKGMQDLAKSSFDSIQLPFQTSNAEAGCSQLPEPLITKRKGKEIAY